MAGSITIAFPTSGSLAPVEGGNLKYACGSWQRPTGTSQPAVVHGIILGPSDDVPPRPPAGTTLGNVSGQTWNFNTNMLPGAALGVDAKLAVWLDIEDCGCYFVAEANFTGCTEGTSDCHPPGDECNDPSAQPTGQTFQTEMVMAMRMPGPATRSAPARGEPAKPIAAKPVAARPAAKPTKPSNQAVIRDVAPRTYHVQLEPRSLQLGQPAGGMFRGGLLAFPRVALHYAADRSTAARAVWCSPQAAKAGTDLVLEVTRGSCGNLRATLTLHRIDGGKVLAPVSWTLLGFHLMQGGVLDQASAPQGYKLGRIQVSRAV